MSRIGLRIKIAALSTVLLAPMLAAAVWAPAADATPASAVHPYSAPFWYPLHDGVAVMDCVRSNPGCPSGHGHADESMTLLTKTTKNPNSYYHAPVYAAGAGVVHLGHIGIKSCPVANQSLGNWVWVYHGAGVISRYAHLYSIQVHEGQLVTPSTVLGYSGNSGIPTQNQCYIDYLNFQVQHNAIAGFGTGYPLSTSVACKPGSLAGVSYPSFFGYSGWNAVPKDTVIPNGGHSCLPTTIPDTQTRPTNVTISPVAPNTLRLAWTKPVKGPAVTRITFELQERNSAGTYYYLLPAYRTITVGATFPTSYQFHGLAINHWYRARLSYYAGKGSSLESYWKTVYFS